MGFPCCSPRELNQAAFFERLVNRVQSLGVWQQLATATPGQVSNPGAVTSAFPPETQRTEVAGREGEHPVLEGSGPGAKRSVPSGWEACGQTPF